MSPLVSRTFSPARHSSALARPSASRSSPARSRPTPASASPSLGLQVRRDTTNRGLLPSRGSTTTAGIEQAGAFGGDYDFTRFTLSWDAYKTLKEDLLDRRTVLSVHTDFGYIPNDAPFFERFYGGGIGSVRGFAFRGISP